MCDNDTEPTIITNATELIKTVAEHKPYLKIPVVDGSGACLDFVKIPVTVDFAREVLQNAQKGTTYNLALSAEIVNNDVHLALINHESQSPIDNRDLVLGQYGYVYTDDIPALLDQVKDHLARRFPEHQLLPVAELSHQQLLEIAEAFSNCVSVNDRGNFDEYDADYVAESIAHLMVPKLSS